jgi:tetratricopeptide (TPR) repeat protein
MMRAARAALIVCAMVGAGCATKVEPTQPSTLAYPDFVYPVVAPTNADQAVAIEHAWRLLQTNALDQADREFRAVAERRPDLAAAKAGQGYVAIARRDELGALARFESALEHAPTYVPALVGQGEVLLRLGREEAALKSLEAAYAADRSLESLRARIDVLRFRVLQNLIASARRARAEGRTDAAIEAYRQALDASPDTAFIYRELASSERAAGNMDLALTHFTRAAELDDTDATSRGQMGELLEARGDYAGAEAAYRRAAALDPGGDFGARADAMGTRARDAGLPAEFRAISGTPAIRRADLAALIGVRIEATLRDAPRSQVVATDIRGHWAAAWIGEVTAAGVMAPFADHTFRPGAPLRRVEMAEAVSVLLRMIATRRPDLQAQLARRPTIMDVSPSHLNYAAIAASVSTGVLPLTAAGGFDPERTVSGADAVAAIDRVRALEPTR